MSSFVALVARPQRTVLVLCISALMAALAAAALWPDGHSRASHDPAGGVGVQDPSSEVQDWSAIPPGKVAPEISGSSRGDSFSVVVTLTGKPEPSRGSDQYLDMSALARSIEEGAARVLAAVPPEDFSLLQRYQLVPALVGDATRAGVWALAAHPDVAHVALNREVHADLTEAVPLIGADDAHNLLGVTGDGVVVAVLDTGIDGDHPLLADDVNHQQCFLMSGTCPGGGTTGPSAKDGNGHGTHVSGIITSAGPPVGVAPDALIDAFKVLDDFGYGTFADVLSAYDEIISFHPEVDVINMSLSDGGGYSPGTCDGIMPALTTAIATTRALGITTFAASGNSGSKSGIGFPACINDVVSVGAVYDADIGYQSWGACADPTTAADEVVCLSQSNISLDLLAPGALIESTVPGKGLATFGGTSAASPAAAAVAALLLESEPLLTSADIETRLKETGVPVTDDGNGVTTCRVDAYEAVIDDGGPICQSAGPPAPANDNFEDAIVVSEPLPYANTQFTVGATMETGEPSPCGGIASTVWYRYTPTSDQALIVDTFGSTYDTVLAVHTGPGVDSLTPVACNDDFGSLQSRVEVLATAGTTYHIQVGGYFGAVGNLTLNLDSFAVPTCPSSPTFSFSLADPSGDDFGSFSPSHDITNVSAEGDDDTFCLTVEFDGPVDPADAGTGQEVLGEIEFDTDQNAATGFTPFMDFFCPDPSGLGVEASLDMFGVSGGFGSINGSPVPVVFDSTSFTAIIPLDLLGDDSSFSFGAVLGSFSEATDCAPADGGCIQSPAGAICQPPPTPTPTPSPTSTSTPTPTPCPPEGCPTAPPTPTPGGKGAILLIKDVNPWSCAANEQALTELGKTYSVISAAQLSSTDLTEFGIVLVASDQFTSTYNTLADRLGQLEEYVNAGGVFVAHATDAGWNGGHWDDSWLPGGAQHVGAYADLVSILDPGSPIVTGKPGGGPVTDEDLDGWNSSTHGYLTDLSPGTDKIIGITGNAADQPTYVHYAFGDGHVFATMQTLEWLWPGCGGADIPSAPAGRNVLRNEILHAQQLVVPLATPTPCPPEGCPTPSSTPTLTSTPTPTDTPTVTDTPTATVTPEGCDEPPWDWDPVNCFETENLWHHELSASVSGMSGGMLAFNQGCTGPGVTGCTFDTGTTVFGRATSPSFAAPSGALLTFQTARSTENACGYWDRTFVLYSTNGGASYAPLDLLTGSITPGGQYLVAGGEICGESLTAQTVSVELPAGTTNIAFGFDSGDSVLNDGAGQFVDDVDLALCPPEGCPTPTPTLSPTPTPTSTPCPAAGNLGFESGAVDSNDIPCWTVEDQSGSYGSWCTQAGTSPPQGPCAGISDSVASPPEGAQAAMTNQSGPGSHVLYQCLVPPLAFLSFDLYINNHDGVFHSPATLDYGVSPNQQFRADLLTPDGIAGDPFTVASEDVLLNVYQTQPGDPAVSGYTTVTADVSAYVGETVCLRFAEVENQWYFNAGVDDIRFTETGPPTPTTTPTPTFTPTPGIKDNDDFAGAVAVPKPLPYANKQDSTGATAEPEEPIPPPGQGCSTQLDATVWYTYTPSSSQAIVADTFGSTYDTQIVVWSGTGIDSLTFVECNDDFEDSLQSQVTFVAVPGTTYYFQLDGYKAATGHLAFSVAQGPPPPTPTATPTFTSTPTPCPPEGCPTPAFKENDDFADAVLVPGPLPFSNEQEVIDATTEPDEPYPPPGQGCVPVFSGTVWYTYVPSSDQTIIADTFGSNHDTQIVVWTGTSIDALGFIGCNDDFGGPQSQVTFAANAGSSYYFQVETSTQTPFNLLVFNLTGQPPPTPTSTPTPCPPEGCPTPTPGLDFSIGIDTDGDGADDCNTKFAEPTECALPSGSTFDLKVYLNDLPVGVPDYQGFDIFLLYAGVDSKDNATADPWPDCAIEATFFGDGWLAFGCISFDEGPDPSTYIGQIGTNGFNCLDSGTITMVHGQSFTALTQDVGSVHIEGDGTTEALAINCVEPPTPTATPTPPPLVPQMQPSPALQNLFLKRQGGKIPPLTCLEGGDMAMLEERLSIPIPGVPDPKDPSQQQELGAFEFEAHYDETKVCVGLVPGPAADDMICIVEDSSNSTLEGVARIGCVTLGKESFPDTETDEGRHLANILVRPQPEIYSQAKPNQDNGVVVQINNVGCELVDLQGHPIPVWSCEDADLTVRYLEGDVTADCEVNAMDTQAIAFRWGAEKGELIYSDFMNLEPAGAQADEDIDIKDLQFVFGRFGSTCADPHPEQAPMNPKV